MNQNTKQWDGPIVDRSSYISMLKCKQVRVDKETRPIQKRDLKELSWEEDKQKIYPPDSVIMGWMGIAI